MEANGARPGHRGQQALKDKHVSTRRRCAVPLVPPTPSSLDRPRVDLSLVSVSGRDAGRGWGAWQGQGPRGRWEMAKTAWM